MELGVVTADVPYVDDCPALTRLKLFLVDQGTCPTIEHVVRDGKGNPIDLTSVFPSEGSESSQSESTQADGSIIVRSKEIIAPAGSGNPIVEVEGEVVDAANGVIRFDTTDKMVLNAGIYQLSIAILDADGRRLKVDNPIMWVQRTLFTFDTTDTTFACGPPSLAEIRQDIVDTGSSDNLLLDEVEFTDEQIANAVASPVQHWNEVPPPIRPALDTRNFPFSEHWKDAIVGHLFVHAAHNYRRNQLAYDAGGVKVDDKNKEDAYLRMGKLMLDEYRDWVTTKKYEINTSLMVGTVGSIYGGLFH